MFFKHRASLRGAAASVTASPEPLPAVKDHLDSGLSLTEEQLSLRRLRKHLTLWFFVTAVFLCVCQVLPHEIASVRWVLDALSIFAIFAIGALCLEFSLIVLLSCCNLTKRYRF